MLKFLYYYFPYICFDLKEFLYYNTSFYRRIVFLKMSCPALQTLPLPASVWALWVTLISLPFLYSSCSAWLSSPVALFISFFSLGNLTPPIASGTPDTQSQDYNSLESSPRHFKLCLFKREILIFPDKLILLQYRSQEKTIISSVV